jgi:hypothetical protein
VNELEVSPDETWLKNFAVMPDTEAHSGDEFVREVRIQIDDAAQLHVTWDTTDRSVRLRYSQHGRLLLNAFREQAHCLLATGAKGERTVVVEYGDQGAVGRIEVRVSPDFAWTDDFLRI